MNTAILFLAAAATVLPASSWAASAPDAQHLMGVDLNACPRPVWPAAALSQRASGQTTVEVQIGEEGVVLDARVLASSGRTDLDAAALAAIRGCVFRAVAATGQAPTGWLKTQYVWVHGQADKPQAPDVAALAKTRELAAAGDAIAQNRLGAWYEHGTHVRKDLGQAAGWYLRAAQSGNAVAQNNLGVLYYRGAGVPRDPAQAAHWYAKAAGQGHAWAQANLAWAYQVGAGVEQDTGLALHWLRTSAETGLAPAQVRLGLLTMERASSDFDRAEAVTWIRRAAAQGHPQGEYYLGRSFELGLGQVLDDTCAAAQYSKVLARSGGRGEIALGLLVEAGRAGTADEDEAARLYQKAMQARNPAAYYHYGRLLERRREDVLAAAVFRQGADLGDCDAVLKYVQLRQALGSAPAAGTVDTYRPRADACAARPERPVGL